MTKGHGILREDGKVEVVSKVITWVREPRDEERVDAIDDHRVSRRIRGKKAAQKRDEERRRLEVLRQVIHEEQLAVEKDEGEVLGVTAVKVRELEREGEKLIEELPGAEERQVLETRMVGQAEVMKNREEWLPAIKAEMQSLLEEESGEDREPRRSQGHDGGSQDQGGGDAWKDGDHHQGASREEEMSVGDMWKLCRRWWKGPGGVALCRWLRRQVDSDGYKYAAERGWAGMVLDIKTAVLNAPQSVMKEGQGSKVVLMRPPAILAQPAR